MKTIIKILVCSFIISNFTACFPIMITRGDYNRREHYWMYNNQRYPNVREYREARRVKEYKDKNESRENEKNKPNNTNRNQREDR